MANKVPLVIADFETTLSGAIAVGATSLTLASATDDDGNALAAGKYCFTVNNGKSNKQYLIGQLNGTAVTSVVSVDRRGNETSGAAFAARSGSPIIISDFATIQRVADILRGQVDLDGDNPISYDAEPTLANREELATVGYVLDTINGGTVDFDNQVITGVNAGETVAAGDLVYFKTSDQEWYKTDADTASTVEGVQLGIALGAGTDGASISGGVQIAGVYTTSGLTAGSLYYASNTAGAIASSAGTTTRVIGIALSTTRLLIIPRTPQDIKDNQKDALAGDATPNSTNTFVTKGRQVTAGATISGGTLPVPVYQNKTDNEFYACDANDTAALKFLGFAISNGTDGNSMYVQFSGIVSGFSGLDEGEKYYVQDAVGTIGTSIGTYEVLVGVAISPTELLIQKGKRRAAGNQSSTITATGSIAVTCGFRPSVVRVKAIGVEAAAATAVSIVDLVWVNGSSKIVNAWSKDTNGLTAADDRLYYNSTSNYLIFAVGSITDTGFTITYTEAGTYNQPTTILWEAEGEL